MLCSSTNAQRRSNRRISATEKISQLLPLNSESISNSNRNLVRTARLSKTVSEYTATSKELEKTKYSSIIFAMHLPTYYIEISGTRCKLLDWNPYDSYGKRQNFKASLITMHGDVSYDSLKKLLCEFFSNKSKQRKNEQINQIYISHIDGTDIIPNLCV